MLLWRGTWGWTQPSCSAAWRLGQWAVLSGLTHKSGGRSCCEPGPSVRVLFSPASSMRWARGGGNGGCRATFCCSEGHVLLLRGAHTPAQLGFAGRGRRPRPSVEGWPGVRALASLNHLKRGLSSKDIYEIARSELKWKYRKRYFILFKCLISERIALNLDVKIPKCLSMWVLKEES